MHYSSCLSMLILIISVIIIIPNIQAFLDGDNCNGEKCGDIHLTRLETTDLPPYHFQMLKDPIRNGAFHNSIKSAVKPGMHVLDIGTGTGLLSMISAQAGASLVTACEKHVTMHTVAQEVLKLNGFENKVKLINKHSYDLIIGEDLPDKADLLVCEILDSYLIGEHMLPTINHAKKNLLKLNPVTQKYNVIPQSAKITVQLIESNYGLSMSGVVEGFNVNPFRKHRQTGSMAIDFEVLPHVPLSEPVDIFAFDFQQVEEHKDETKQLTVDVINSGMLNSVVIWWTVNVDENNSFTTGPKKNTHWGQGMVLFFNDVELFKGGKARLTATHNTTSLSFSVDRI